jgi:anti-sigma B factor antagonist
MASGRFTTPRLHANDAPAGSTGLVGGSRGAIELSVASERWGITHRIAPSGELDLATSPLLERELIRVERTGVSLIELDLSGVTFMDSAGVCVLARAEARAQLSGSALIVKSASTAVQRVLALVGPDESLRSTNPTLGAHGRVLGRRSDGPVAVDGSGRSDEPTGHLGFPTDWSH